MPDRVVQVAIALALVVVLPTEALCQKDERRKIEARSCETSDSLLGPSTSDARGERVNYRYDPFQDRSWLFVEQDVGRGLYPDRVTAEFGFSGRVFSGEPDSIVVSVHGDGSKWHPMQVGINPSLAIIIDDAQRLPARVGQTHLGAIESRYSSHSWRISLEEAGVLARGQHAKARVLGSSDQRDLTLDKVLPKVRALVRVLVCRLS